MNNTDPNSKTERTGVFEATEPKESERLADTGRSGVDRLLQDSYDLELRQKLAAELGAEFVGGFHCERAYVKRGNKYFFIDREGKRINEEEYDDVKDFSEGVAAAGFLDEDYNGLYFYIDLKGKRIGKDTYSGAESYSEGLAAIRLGEDRDPYQSADGIGTSGNCCYIDKEGKIALEGPFTGGGPFMNGFAEVNYGFETGCKGCYGPAVIDKKGDTVLDMGQNGRNIFIRLPNPKSERPEDNFVYEDELEAIQCGAYDLTGDRSLFPFIVWYSKLDENSEPQFPVFFGKFTLHNFREAEELRNKIATYSEPYWDHGKSRYTGLFKIDMREEWKLCADQLWHSELVNFGGRGGFSEGRRAIRLEEGKWIYMGEDGKPVNDKTYYHAGPFQCGVAVVCCAEDSKCRLIRPDGSFVSDAAYDSVGVFKDGVAEAWLGRKQVLIDTTGRIVFGNSQESGPETDRSAPIASYQPKPGEDKGASRVKQMIAERLSGGDEQLLSIVRRHMESNGGRADRCAREENGIPFFFVGEDETRQIYLGAKDGKVYRFSIGEWTWDEISNQLRQPKEGPFELSPDDADYQRIIQNI